MMAMLLKLIPPQYRIAAALVLVFAIFSAGLGMGYRYASNQAAAAQAKAAKRIAELERENAEKADRVVTQYVDRIKKVYVKGQTVVQKVPVYVSKESDAGCTIPAGFVSMHDSAARNELPPPAGPADAQPSTVELSAVAATVVGNYATCEANAEQLKALQAWAASVSGEDR